MLGYTFIPAPDNGVGGGGREWGWGVGKRFGGKVCRPVCVCLHQTRDEKPFNVSGINTISNLQDTICWGIGSVIGSHTFSQYFIWHRHLIFIKWGVEFARLLTLRFPL